MRTDSEHSVKLTKRDFSGGKAKKTAAAWGSCGATE
jgi:hypothetical protein